MRRQKQPQLFCKNRYSNAQLTIARSYSDAEGTAAHAHSFGGLNHSRARLLRRRGIAIRRGSCTTHTQKRNRLHRNLDTVIQLLTLRLTARSSTGENNCSAHVRPIQAKNRTRRAKLMLSQELRALNSFERGSANRLKF